MITWERNPSYEADRDQELMVGGNANGFIWRSAHEEWHGRLYGNNDDSDVYTTRVTGTTEREIKQAMLAELVAMRMR